MARGLPTAARGTAIARSWEERQIGGERRRGEQYEVAWPRSFCGLLLAQGAYPFIEAS